MRYAASRCTTLHELKRNDSKKNRWLENQKVTGKKKILVLLTLEISRESYLSQLSCSHMELVQSLAPPRRNDRELPIPVVASRINTVAGPLPPRNQRVQELRTRWAPVIVVNGLLWGPYKWSKMNGHLEIITMITPIKWSYGAHLINWCLGPLWYHFKIFRTSKVITCYNPRGPLW